MLVVEPNAGLEIMTLRSRPELRSRVGWMLKGLSYPGAPICLSLKLLQ